MSSKSNTVPGSGSLRTVGWVTSADGIRLSYEVRGAGMPALVLVHGWSCDRSYWDGQVEVLSRMRQVITVDLAGHGESGTGRKAWTIEAFGADVADVVNGLALKSMILIGHSMGGDVIVEAARRLPGRIKGLVWVDTYRQLANFPPPEQVEQRLAPFRADFVRTTRSFVRAMFAPGADESLVERVALDMSAAPADIAIEALESTWNSGPRLIATLQEVRLPVVAMNPEDPPTDIESLQRYGIEVVTMPRVGHFLPMEHPRQFSALLLRVIERFIQ